MSEVYGTYLIPSSRLDGMTKLINKLARKIAKGKTHADFEPTIDPMRTVVMEQYSNNLFPIKPNVDYSDKNVAEYTWVTIKYQQPVLNGWSLVAVYDWETTPEGVRTCFVSTVPDQMVLPEYRNVEDGECNHCHTNRKRNKSMLITKNFLEYKVVGSTCIKDFLGHHTPNSLIDVFKFEQELRSYWSEFSGPAMESYTSVEYILQLAAMFVRRYGYKKTSDMESTVSRLMEYLDPCCKEEIEYVKNHKPSLVDQHNATQTIEWIKGQSTASDYIDTLNKCITAGAVTSKRFGVVCSSVGVYLKSTETKAPVSNEWIGTVGERIKSLTAAVDRVRFAEGMYGMTTIVTLVTNSGDIITWFASKELDVEKHDTWKFDATIKKHDDFNGRKQTVVTRVKYVTMGETQQEAAA
jgi:hypothetical protein